MKTNVIDSEKQEAERLLRIAMPEGTTVYTVLRHVSASGMMRVIDVYIIKDDIPLRYSWSVAKLIGATYDKKHEGVKVVGCGMDMGFHIVNSLGYALFGYDKGVPGNPGSPLIHRWI